MNYISYAHYSLDIVVVNYTELSYQSPCVLLSYYLLFFTIATILALQKFWCLSTVFSENVKNMLAKIQCVNVISLHHYIIVFASENMYVCKKNAWS